MTAGHGSAALHVEGPDADGFRAVVFGQAGFDATFGRVLCRSEGEALARVRFTTGADRANQMGSLHGGFLLACLDQAVFMGPAALGRLVLPDWAVTLGLSTQFLAAGSTDGPLDCLVEIVSETGRLMFLRGQMEQEGRALLTYQGTLRKVSLAPR